MLDQDYALPENGEALLLLIEEGARGTVAPRVGVYTLDAPTYVRPPIDRSLDKQARLKLMSAAARAEDEVWGRAIAAHPAVRAFRGETP